MTSTREQLNEFAALYNSKDKSLAPFVHGMKTFTWMFRDAIEKAYLRQFTEHGVRDYVGVSSLGYPAVKLGLKQIGYTEDTPNLRTKFIFFVGDAYEILITNLLRSHGFDVTHDQHTIDYYGVPGHLDGVLNNDLLIEIKTMNDRYFKEFTKEPNDSRAYITQLSIYRACMHMPAVWLCVNKDTNELAVVDLPSEEIRQPYLQRAYNLAAILPKLKTFEDVFSTFEAPEPVPEVYAKKPTGACLMPQSMAYWQYSPVFYKLLVTYNNYGKVQTYVTDYTTYDEACQVLVSVFNIPF